MRQIHHKNAFHEIVHILLFKTSVLFLVFKQIISKPYRQLLIICLNCARQADVRTLVFVMSICFPIYFLK